MFKSLIFSVLLLGLITGCSEKRKIINDNATADLTIESVAESNDLDITDGNALFSTGDYRAAIRSYEKATKDNKATAFYNIGVSYYLLNNTPMAELNFREAVKADPNFDEAVMNLVAVLAEQGPEKAKEAEEYITRFINTNKSAKVFVEIANVYLNINDMAKAVYYYRKALEVDSKSPYVLENYANFLITIGEYQDGVNILENLADKSFAVLYNLANAYYGLGNKVSATNYAENALYTSGGTEIGYDKLAQLFNKLKKYKEEVQTLRTLISGNSKRDYRIRLIKAYLSLSENTKALDEINILLSLFPEDEDLNLLKYNILVYIHPDEAGKYIRKTYDHFKSDKVLSYYVKHVCYFDKTQNEVLPLLKNNRTNGWMSLAKTVYALKKGNYKNAAEYIKNASVENGHDFYAYHSFLSIKNRNYTEAAVYAENLDLLQYDTFWYKLVVAWNLGKPQELLSLGEEYKNSSLITVRPPTFEFNIRPVLDDMSFTYPFNDKGIDVASMLAYPVFLKPDETAQYLITGMGALKERDRNTVTDKLEGIKTNNAGIEAFYAFDLYKALKNFQEATLQLPNNSYAFYNLALTYFNLGDNIKALDTIKQAMAIDKNNGFVHLVSGLVNARIGNYPEARKNFDQAKVYALKSIRNDNFYLDENVMLLYLSILAINKDNMKKEAEGLYPSSKNGYAATVSLFMDYFEHYDINKLKDLDNSPIFRASRIKKLLELRFLKSTDIYDIEDPDRYYTLAYKYIMLHRGAANEIKFNNIFSKDKVYLKDMVYAYSYTYNKARGLSILQDLSNIDNRYIELYKVSLYYFTWIKDFVNAEASYGTLDRIGYKDQTTLYYMLLYFLSNFSGDRLNTYLKMYQEAYGEDYRSDVILALMNLYTKNINAFSNIVSTILQKEPYLFDKMFIEINFEKF